MAADWLLAVESSSEQASAALARGGELTATAGAHAGRKQSEVLMTPLQEVLAGLEIGARLSAVIIGTGPGSYNGARVGIAAGQGVALVHDCPAAGVCSLEALPVVRAGGACLAVGDARRGTFFAIPLRHGRLEAEPLLLEHDAFLERVETAVLAGADVVTLEDPGRLRLPETLASQVRHTVPSAALLLEAWAEKSPEERKLLMETPPQPFYLRPPHIT